MRAHPTHPVGAVARTGALLLQREFTFGSSVSSLTGESEECSKNKRLLLQTKLDIGSVNDPLEQEADRIADHVLSASVGGTVSDSPVRIQRISGQQVGQSDVAPVSVDRALAGSGRPLEPALRQNMEQRFGHDFARVRVHTDMDAVRSARDTGAQAYTVGQHLVFAEGRYAPATHEGRRLLAHELTHVLQQGAGASTTVRRKINVDDFDSDTFPDEVLDSFLKNFSPDNIENHSDSDEKARTILRQVLDGKRPVPAVDKLIMMIMEMQAGWTGSDDEHAILNILFKCEKGGAGWPGLGEIFSAKGDIDPEDLDDDFQGEEEDVLRAFYDRVFVGGREAALDGSSKLKDRASKEPEKGAAVPDYTPPESDEESEVWARQASRLKDDLLSSKNDPKVGKGIRNKAIDLARILASSLSSSSKLPKPNQARLDNLREGLKSLFELMSLAGDWDSIAGIASTVEDTHVHENAIKSLSNDASGSVGQQRFLVRLGRIYGETLTKPAPNDPKGWLQANTEIIGRVFMAIDRENLSNKDALKLMAPSLMLDQKLLNEYSKHIDDAPYDPLGRLTPAMKVNQKNQILLDCDGYAAYGARLLRAGNWETFGYMVINPQETRKGGAAGELRDSHAVVMARKPSNEQGRWLWVGVSNVTIKELGGSNTALTEAEAWRQLLLLAHEGYDATRELKKYKAYHLPAIEGGAIDPRLLDAKKYNLSAYVDSP